MPSPSISLDTVENSQVSIEKGLARIVRGGIAKNLDTSLPSYEIQSQVLGISGMPAYDSAFPGSTYPNAYLSRIIIDPIKGVNWMARVTLIYEEQAYPTTGGPITFILARKSQLITTTTQKHPSNKHAMKFSWANPNNAGQKRGTTTATFTYLKPLKTLTVTGYFRGELPDAMDQAYAHVNSQTWQGYPKGYWLFAGIDEKTEDRGRSYALQLSFVTNVTEDWSSWEFFRDPATGLVLPVKNEDVESLEGDGYYYDWDGSKNGVIKAGLYDLANFNSIFGF